MSVSGILRMPLVHYAIPVSNPSKVGIMGRPCDIAVMGWPTRRVRHCWGLKPALSNEHPPLIPLTRPVGREDHGVAGGVEKDEGSKRTAWRLTKRRRRDPGH